VSSQAGSESSSKAVLRDACKSYWETIGVRLEEAFKQCKNLSGNHGKVVEATIELVAAVSLAIVNLGDTNQDSSSLAAFMSELQSSLVTSFAVLIATYNPQVELENVFREYRNEGVDLEHQKIIDDVIEKFKVKKNENEEILKIQGLKEKIKDLENQYNQRIEDLISIFKYGKVLRTNGSVIETKDVPVEPAGGKNSHETVREIFMAKHLVTTEVLDTDDEADSLDIISDNQSVKRKPKKVNSAFLCCLGGGQKRKDSKKNN
jgi:hypothetical protein